VPTFPLASGTLHAVVVTTANERVESWFITEGIQIEFRPAPQEDSGEGAFEHVVHYQPTPAP